jgi:hypothetical protein
MTTTTDFTVNPPQFRYGIDYIAATLPIRNKPQNILPDVCMKEWDGEILDRGSPGYNRSILTPYGWVNWHADDPRQKIHLICSGSALENMTTAKYNHLYLLERIQDLGGVLTRIDAAADTFQPSTPFDVYAAWLAGEIKTQVKIHEWHVSGTKEEPGMTFCLGKREDSNRYLRVYDRIANLKGKGQNPGDVDFWTRIELEAKKDLAPKIGLAMRNFGIVPTVKKCLQDTLKTQIGWVNTLLYNAEMAYIEPVGRKETDPLKWHMDTTLPSMDKTLGDPNTDTFEALKLLKQMKHIYDKHIARIRADRRTYVYLGKEYNDIPKSALDTE